MAWRSSLMMVLAAWPLLVGAADPAVTEFERFIKRAKAQTEALKHVHYDETFKSWSRSAYTVRNVHYDVVKTDSLIAPLAGKVSFWLLASYSSYPTREEAAAAKINPPPLSDSPSEVVEFTFAYRNGAWELGAGRAALGLGATWFDAGVNAITADVVRNQASIFRALVPWLSSRPPRR